MFFFSVIGAIQIRDDDDDDDDERRLHGVRPDTAVRTDRGVDVPRGSRAS